MTPAKKPVIPNVTTLLCDVGMGERNSTCKGWEREIVNSY